ncbi:hypothetical protein Dda_8515 [Drechslerella dactyloides]|uniref:Core domain-containing protein n=1 Tax=Drechslerella dactyloides TaxID=74499 RepID=A0AAD6IS90_DREDA|nr:hypothetical protein Dda_8515 [Drechslerella dactyloides]
MASTFLRRCLPRHARPLLAPRPRLLHTSAPRPLNVTNPQKDPDGNPLTITITPAASTRLSQILAKERNPAAAALRVLVTSGGCHGFQYTMSLTDAIDAAEDTIFEEGDGARVVMDLPSLELLSGSKVDYENELIGSQFRIVDNPAATSSCGCGASFDVKF